MKRKIFLQGKNINGEKFKIELTSNKIENLVNVPLEIKSKDKLTVHPNKINRRKKRINNTTNKFKKVKNEF